MIKQSQLMEHAPTLKTIIMVENTLKRYTILTIPELKRKLPKQINHNTLKTILEYLEESNKIFVSLKGISWIENNNPKLIEAIKKGTQH